MRLEKNDPEYARIGLWSSMAREGYAAVSEEGKKETVRKAREVLEKDINEWEEALALPKSIEEAVG